MKIGMFLLVAVVAVLALFVYSQETAIRQQQHTIDQLDAQIQTAAKSTAFDFQERCAKQAKDFFTSKGWTSNDPDKPNLGSYANHYDPALNKCFMVIDNTLIDTGKSDQPFNTEVLFDAFDGITYGEFMFRADPVKKYWEVKPVACHVILPSGERRECQSKEEFHNLLATYMGEGFH
jgi:hypothetical protein